MCGLSGVRPVWRLWIAQISTQEQGDRKDAGEEVGSEGLHLLPMGWKERTDAHEIGYCSAWLTLGRYKTRTK